MKQITIGTRGSELALAQSQLVARALRRSAPGIEIEIRVIRTRGDRRLDLSLASTGPLNKGLFTKELETALANGEVDVAVHSLKDLPVELPDGFALGAVLARANPADVLVTRAGDFGRLTAPVIGTSSPRRTRQLEEVHPAWGVREIRGNVPTRLRSLFKPGGPDGVVLALAGLTRLGLVRTRNPAFAGGGEFGELQIQPLPWMLPAPGQGAVAVEFSRTASPRLPRLLEHINCPRTAACVAAERSLLAACGGGCHLALGARAVVRRGRLQLHAVFYPAGAGPMRGTIAGPPSDPDGVAQALAGTWKL